MVVCKGEFWGSETAGEDPELELLELPFGIDVRDQPLIVGYYCLTACVGRLDRRGVVHIQCKCEEEKKHWKRRVCSPKRTAIVCKTGLLLRSCSIRLIGH